MAGARRGGQPGRAAVHQAAHRVLLRRLVTKHAVASVTGRPTDPATLAGIEVRNAPSGAPYVCVDGAPIEVGVSISDRAGWAVCVTSPTGPLAVGCDLELVEPRTPGFVRDFLTAAEQRWIASRAAGDERDMGANLVWSAKESALKVLRTGLRRDTRTVEVTLAAPRADGWGELTVRAVRGHGVPRLVAARRPIPAHRRRGGGRSRRRSPSATRAVLAAAEPRHSWLDRPLYLLTSPGRGHRRCRAATPRR